MAYPFPTENLPVITTAPEELSSYLAERYNGGYLIEFTGDDLDNAFDSVGNTLGHSGSYDMEFNDEVGGNDVFIDSLDESTYHYEEVYQIAFINNEESAERQMRIYSLNQGDVNYPAINIDRVRIYVSSQYYPPDANLNDQNFVRELNYTVSKLDFSGVTEPEEPSTTLKDLTNTTWHIPAGWAAAAGYGQFNVNYDCSWGFDDRDYQSLYIGYDPTPEPADNMITDNYLSSLHNQQSFDITFTGGTDATNTSLIAWLTENGELQGEEEKPIFTYDLTQLNLAAGTYSITIVAKAAGYNDASSNTVQFVVEQESFVEETNEYGTTMVINKYIEESNEYGTTMIIGGEAVS